MVFYNSHEKKSAHQAEIYSKTTQTLSRYLAYRDIPFLVKKYTSGTYALDYGCGTGISTEFILHMGFQVTGIDVSKEMLDKAVSFCPEANFKLVENGSIPSNSGVYDLVFSSFVLFEIGSPTDIIRYLKEAKRVLKKSGILIAVTGGEELYSRNWQCLFVDYPDNKNLKSGDKAKLFLPEVGMEFTDYYWKEADYKQFFVESEFSIIEIHYPLGKANEQYSWKDEKRYPPFVIFVAKSN